MLDTRTAITDRALRGCRQRPHRRRPGSRANRWVATTAGGVLVSLLTAAVLVPLLRQREPRLRQPVDDKPVVRLQLTLPDDVTPVRGQPPAVSPDGTRIAMVAVDQTS